MVAVIYEPREDSELLLSVVCGFAKPGMRVLDMGTGTGIVAIGAAEQGAEVVGVDINPEAVDAARSNAVEKRAKVEFKVSDLFQNVDGKFDLIVFNPPYLPEDEREDVESRINTTDNGVISRFLNGAGNHLTPKGFILILVSSLTPTHVEGEVVAQKRIPFETLSVIKVKNRGSHPQKNRTLAKSKV